MKNLSVDSCCELFLGLPFQSEVNKQLEKHSTTFWHAVNSSGISTNIFGFQSTYGKGVQAKDELHKLFDLAQPPSLALDLKMDEEEEKKALLLLLTSSLTYKAFASLITSFLKVTAEHPETMQKLQKEIPGGSIYGLDKLKDLKYLNACLLETERLYPPCIGTLIAVKGTVSSIVIGNTEMKPGEKLFCSFLSANRDERIYGKDALEFRPERWLTQPPPQPHLTYGFGARSCPGQTFVKKLALKICSMWVSKFEWELVNPSSSSSYKWLPVSRPKSGLFMKIEYRRQA